MGVTALESSKSSGCRGFGEHICREKPKINRTMQRLAVRETAFVAIETTLFLGQPANAYHGSPAGRGQSTGAAPGDGGGNVEASRPFREAEIRLVPQLLEWPHHGGSSEEPGEGAQEDESVTGVSKGMR